MKKILLFTTIMALCMAFTSELNAPQGKAKIGVGTKLTYAANFMGKKCDFIVTLTGKEAGGITFDYNMTDADKTTGSVSISPDAVSTAIKQNNYFVGGKMQLREATAIWLSNKVYNNLKNGAANIDIGSGSEVLTLKEKVKMSVKMGGKNKEVKVLYAETQTGHKFWILDDKNNPVVLKFDTGWTLDIKEIN